MAQRYSRSHWSARLQQVTQHVGLTAARGALVAFGDYNADNFVDLFLVAAPGDAGSTSGTAEVASRRGGSSTLSPEGEGGADDAEKRDEARVPHRELQAWLWRGDGRTGHFALSSEQRWAMPGLLGVIPGDFNGDGQLDAIAMLEHPRCAAAGAIVLAQCNHTFGGCVAAEGALAVLPTAAASQPLALDYDGDMRTDLLAAWRPIADDAGSNCTSQLGEVCDGPSYRGRCCDCGLVCAHSRRCELPAQAEPYVWLNRWGGGAAFTPVPFLANLSAMADAEADADAPSVPTDASQPAAAALSASATAAAPAEQPRPPLRLAVPNSNANVDLNGDCRADLLLIALPADAPAHVASCASVACELLLWLQHVPTPASLEGDAAGAAADDDANGDVARSAPRTAHADESASVGDAKTRAPPVPRWAAAPSVNMTLPIGASQLSFADMDADGLLDLVFVSQPRSPAANTTLHIWYAQMLAPTDGAANDTPTGIANASCVPRPRAPLCTAPEELALSFHQTAFSLPAGWRLSDGGATEAAAAGLPVRPPTLAVADFFLDGFPDVLLPLRAPDGWTGSTERGCRAGQRCLTMLMNDDELRCDESGVVGVYNAAAPPPPPRRAASDFGGAAVGAGGGGDDRVFPLIPGASGGAFFDLFEDGTWDVLALYPNGSLAAWRQPEATLDSYFLKVVASDGACVPAPLDRDPVLPGMPTMGSATPPTPPTAHRAERASWAQSTMLGEGEQGGAERGGDGGVRRLAMPDGQRVVESGGGGRPAIGGRAAIGGRGGVGRVEGAPTDEEEASGGRDSRAHKGVAVDDDDGRAHNDADSLADAAAEGASRLAQRERDGRCVQGAGSQGYMAGLNQPGVSYQFLTSLPTRWEMMDVSDAWKWNRPKQPRAGAQLVQSAYAPLLTPYVLVGLGHTNGYVEGLMVGLPSGQARAFTQAIVPNSRLVVIPHPYNQTNRWELRLYLEPRRQVSAHAPLAAPSLLPWMARVRTCTHTHRVLWRRRWHASEGPPALHTSGRALDVWRWVGGWVGVCVCAACLCFGASQCAHVRLPPRMHSCTSAS